MRVAALGTFVLLLLAPPAHAIRVLAATNDLGALARAAGDTRVTVEVVADPATDPHVHAVDRENVLQARRADFFLTVGLALDSWSGEIVADAKKPALQVIDCSGGVTVLGAPAEGTPAGNHPEGNPHYWLDPARGVEIVRMLAARFGESDRMYAAVYKANAERFAARVEERLPFWDGALRGRAVVAVHDAWPYLAERFGLDVLAVLEPVPGTAASSADVTALAQRLEGTEPLVLVAAHRDAAALNTLRKGTGGRIVAVPTSCAEPTPDAYVAMFDGLAEAVGGATPPSP